MVSGLQVEEPPIWLLVNLPHPKLPPTSICLFKVSELVLTLMQLLAWVLNQSHGLEWGCG